MGYRIWTVLCSSESLFFQILIQKIFVNYILVFITMKQENSIFFCYYKATSMQQTQHRNKWVLFLFNMCTMNSNVFVKSEKEMTLVKRNFHITTYQFLGTHVVFSVNCAHILTYIVRRNEWVWLVYCKWMSLAGLL